MKTNTNGAKIHVVTGIVVKTFIKNPLAVTAVLCSRDHIVAMSMYSQAEDLEEVCLTLEDSFNLEKDYLVALTRSGENGKTCQYTLLAGTAPVWFNEPQREAFNLLGDSGTMETSGRIIVAMPLAYIAYRVAHEQPQV